MFDCSLNISYLLSTIWKSQIFFHSPVKFLFTCTPISLDVVFPLWIYDEVPAYFKCTNIIIVILLAIFQKLDFFQPCLEIESEHLRLKYNNYKDIIMNNMKIL